eukprot:3408189-Prymnesium_polylepis.1
MAVLWRHGHGRLGACELAHELRLLARGCVLRPGLGWRRRHKRRLVRHRRHEDERALRSKEGH